MFLLHCFAAVVDNRIITFSADAIDRVPHNSNIQYCLWLRRVDQAGQGLGNALNT